MRYFDERYVLRLWQETAKENNTRASLTKLHSGETKYFSDILSLIKHIQDFEHKAQSNQNN